jgi:hypothetical protein
MNEEAIAQLPINSQSPQSDDLSFVMRAHKMKIGTRVAMDQEDKNTHVANFQPSLGLANKNRETRIDSPFEKVSNAASHYSPPRSSPFVAASKNERRRAADDIDCENRNEGL